MWVVLFLLLSPMIDCFLLLLGLASCGRAAPVLCLLFSLFFVLGQLGFVLLHYVLVASVLAMLRKPTVRLFLIFLAFPAHIAGGRAVSLRQNSGRHSVG